MSFSSSFSLSLSFFFFLSLLINALLKKNLINESILFKEFPKNSKNELKARGEDKLTSEVILSIKGEEIKISKNEESIIRLSLDRRVL